MRIIAEAYRIRAVAFETPVEPVDVDKKDSALVNGKRDLEEANGGPPNPDLPHKNDGSLDFGR